MRAELDPSVGDAAVLKFIGLRDTASISFNLFVPSIIVKLFKVLGIYGTYAVVYCRAQGLVFFFLRAPGHQG
jgi:hypothetical protein